MSLDKAVEVYLNTNINVKKEYTVTFLNSVFHILFYFYVSLLY